MKAAEASQVDYCGTCVICAEHINGPVFVADDGATYCLDCARKRGLMGG